MTKSQFFVDYRTLQKPEFKITDSGLLRVKGTIARTGNMTYHTNKGEKYYQYVPPDTLFNDTHLDSIAGVPVTLNHPEEPINPNNYKTYAVGSVGDRVFANIEKGLIEVVFHIGDAEAIDAATNGNINQLSCGYWATLKPHPDKLDTLIQVERTCNHIALVDKARGGDSLKLNLDAWNITDDSNYIPEEDNKSKWRTLYVMV